jgi:hypothetical protein
VAANRDTSKQKRARQNRAQREALKARTEAASKPATERRPTPAPASKATTTAGGDATEAAPRKGGFFSGGNRGPRPGDLPVDVDALEGNWLQKRMQVPGGRHVISALVLSILLSVMLAFQKFPPEGQPEADPTESIIDILGPVGWGVLLYPILVVAIAAQLSLHPKRRRIWMACTIVLGAAVMALLQIYIVHLIVVGYLIFAMQKAARVEGPARPPAAPRRSRRGAAEEADEAVDPVEDRPS